MDYNMKIPQGSLFALQFNGMHKSFSAYNQTLTNILTWKFVLCLCAYLCKRVDMILTQFKLDLVISSQRNVIIKEKFNTILKKVKTGLTVQAIFNNILHFKLKFCRFKINEYFSYDYKKFCFPICNHHHHHHYVIYYTIFQNFVLQCDLQIYNLKITC